MRDCFAAAGSSVLYFLRCGKEGERERTDPPFFFHLISPLQFPSNFPTTLSAGTCLIFEYR